MRRLMLLRHAKTETDAPSPAAIRTAGSTTAAAATPPKSAAGSPASALSRYRAGFAPRSGRSRPGKSPGRR